MHVSDWFPTFAGLAGADPTDDPPGGAAAATDVGDPMRRSVSAALPFDASAEEVYVLGEVVGPSEESAEESAGSRWGGDEEAVRVVQVVVWRERDELLGALRSGGVAPSRPTRAGSTPVSCRHF